MAANVQVWWDQQEGRYNLQFPFDRAFVDALKDEIPKRCRTYDPQTRIWTVTEGQLVPVLDIIERVGLRAAVTTREEIEGEEAKETVRYRIAPIADVALSFMRLVPHPAMLKAYRAAAMLLHPDRNGGDGSFMSALNAAWTRLEKEIYRDPKEE